MRGRLSLMAGLAYVFIASQAGAQATDTIDGSPHDLGGLNSADNDEICVYCHTPHGARLDIEAPLWNKPGGTATYTTYDNTTIDGDILPVGSVSVACLTCHDGTQAMDAILNAPGAGMGGLAGGTAGNAMTGTPVPVLGTDLTDDHPIGIQYGGFDPGGGQVDPDFKNSTDGLQFAVINGANRWWVDTEASPNGTRDKSDMILYTRVNTVDGNAEEPFVECATCHDPHLGNGTATEVNFMRISNTNSDVCLACHVK